MAKNTNLDLRGQLMYSVFVRNHTKEGTFRALEGDLDRIAALGTDIIWLMPIHPIGKAARKGELGSPYAISDYRGINPEYGTKEDLIHLVEAIHARGMKCIIDVVYNDTSPDSVLAAEHPEYFFHDAEGKLVKTGFATGGGNTYYYDNLVRVKGFTKIGEDYYFFNASSGVMQCDKNLWVSSSNPYGIKGATYYFGADGKMVL